MKYLICLILISCFGSLLAQDSLEVNSMKNHIIELEQNIESLKTEINILNNMNGRILDSVYWTIGIIVTVFIGFGLFNYISNTKLNNARLDEISSNIKTDFSTLEIKLQQKNDNISESNLLIVKELEELLSKRITNQINSKVSDIDNRLCKMQTQIYANSISHYEKNSNFDQSTYFDKYSTLSNLREILILEIYMDKHYSYDYHVDFHKRLDTIHKYVKERNVDMFEKEQLVQVLDKLPEKFSEPVQMIKNDINVDRISNM